MPRSRTHVWLVSLADLRENMDTAPRMAGNCISNGKDLRLSCDSEVGPLALTVPYKRLTAEICVIYHLLSLYQSGEFAGEYFSSPRLSSERPTMDTWDQLGQCIVTLRAHRAVQPADSSGLSHV